MWTFDENLDWRGTRKNEERWKRARKNQWRVTDVLSFRTDGFINKRVVESGGRTWEKMRTRTSEAPETSEHRPSEINQSAQTVLLNISTINNNTQYPRSTAERRFNLTAGHRLEGNTHAMHEIDRPTDSR